MNSRIGDTAMEDTEDDKNMYIVNILDELNQTQEQLKDSRNSESTSRQQCTSTLKNQNTVIFVSFLVITLSLVLLAVLIYLVAVNNFKVLVMTGVKLFECVPLILILNVENLNNFANRRFLAFVYNVKVN